MLDEISDVDRKRINMVIVWLMLSYTMLVVTYKLVLLIRYRIAPIIKLMEYENIDETRPNTTTTTNLELSVEERKGKIDALFFRSKSLLVNNVESSY